MTRTEILENLHRVFEDQFEITDPDPEAQLREAYDFDSIDAIELLVEIEKMLGRSLSQSEKKKAMDIRTLNQVVDYIEWLISRGGGAS
ncbi:MAG: acyl carrier protein [Desulfobacterales bacterium]|nr:MAG: acyl carrier protein [Desulfobacterales bacterium]